jgi:hypothetical protein
MYTLMYNQSYCIINRVNKIKYLGLIFDYNMRCNIHIFNITIQLRAITFKLFKLNRIIFKNIMRIVYIYMSLY